MVSDHMQDVSLAVHHILILKDLLDGNKTVGVLLTSLQERLGGCGKLDAPEITRKLQVQFILGISKQFKRLIKKVVERALP